MLDGDFERAWQITDRLELDRGPVRGGCHLLWNGAPLAGRTVLVRCCHGLGDTIQFLRYLPLLRRVAKRVNVALQPELRELFPGLDCRHAAWDVEIECMELPYAFRTRLDTIPSDVPYLPTEYIRQTRAGFEVRRSANKRNAGLIWAAGAWDPRRSLALVAARATGCGSGHFAAQLATRARAR